MGHWKGERAGNENRIRSQLSGALQRQRPYHSGGGGDAKYQRGSGGAAACAIDVGVSGDLAHCYRNLAGISLRSYQPQPTLARSALRMLHV